MAEMGTSIIVSTPPPVSIITPPPPPVTFGARHFNYEEYSKYKHNIHGMPQDIPELSAVHYMSVIVPLLLLLILTVHYKNANDADYAAELSETKNIRRLLVLGVFFAGIVIAIHLRIIPVRYVRVLFPRWKTPPPMSKAMKALIAFCFLAFIIYPTVKFIRRQGQVPRVPQVHKLLTGAE
jgi:hypothetical protein